MSRHAHLASWEDYRRLSRRRLPRLLYDYIEGGASAEATLAANRGDFSRLNLRPGVMCDVSGVDLGTTLLGQTCKLPVMLGPVGSLGAFRLNGERAAFRAAHASGIPACLSSFSIAPPEGLLDPMPAGHAFQLYVLRDRGRTAALLDRVNAAGFDTLIVTVDTAVSGVRERDIRNGLRRLARPGPALLADFARRPGWVLDMARSHPLTMFLARDWPEAGHSYMAQAAFLAGQIDPSLDWSTLEWLGARWRGRIIVKGILTPEDATRAVERGVAGIVVSNHGGRQLDGVISTIRALPAIADAVGDGAEVLLDGGIRRGGDIVKALALGASGCLLGRGYVHALVAGGEAGLAAWLAALETEMTTTLALMGLKSIAALRAMGRQNLTGAIDPPAAAR